MEKKSEFAEITALIECIKRHPELPVIPMVDYDVVDDEVTRYMGSIGECYVANYLVTSKLVHIYDDKDMVEMIDAITEVCDDLGGKLLDTLDDIPDDTIRWLYDRLDWKQAIFVDINRLEVANIA